MLLAFTLSAQRQNTRPDFTGLWRSVSITLGPITNSVEEIEQTDFTVALRPVISNEPSTGWVIYSTDGKVRRTKMGRHLIEEPAIGKRTNSFCKRLDQATPLGGAVPTKRSILVRRRPPDDHQNA